MFRRGVRLAVVLALLALGARARAEDAPPDSPPKDKATWLLSTDEDAPEPPLIKAQAGVILWPYLRTSITIGRKSSLPGHEIDDSEAQGGLQNRWLSPFLEATAGTTIATQPMTIARMPTNIKAFQLRASPSRTSGSSATPLISMKRP